MKIYYSILDYTISILAIAAAFSFGAIKTYLVKRKLVKWKLAYVDPFSFFGKYIESTKNDTGRIGIWFWVMIYSAISGIFLGFVEGALHLFAK